MSRFAWNKDSVRLSTGLILPWNRDSAGLCGGLMSLLQHVSQRVLFQLGSLVNAGTAARGSEWVHPSTRFGFAMGQSTGFMQLAAYRPALESATGGGRGPGANGERRSGLKAVAT
jgi:hypothetical protein